MTQTHAALRPVLARPVGARDHFRGPDAAELTVVEYGDYRCPSCRGVHAILRDAQQRMGGRMRIVFRNFPMTTIQPDAQIAAEAAEAAGAQGKFWEMHDYLLEHQPDLRGTTLHRHAALLGLDVRQFGHALEFRTFAGRVYADFLGGIRSGVCRTPTFFLNGVRHGRDDGSPDVPGLLRTLLSLREGRWEG